jgi:predicted NAD/FAD-dependent oxidoreductase
VAVSSSTSSHPPKWRIEDVADGSDLGEFDWVIIGDRKEVTSDLVGSSSSLSNYLPIPAVPILSLMVVIESNDLVKSFPYSGVRFDNHPVLGWIAKENSKPGRERSDNKELWTLQSSAAFATELIK